MTTSAILPFKAAAHDLDNTLLHGSDISRENVLAVKHLSDLGLINLIATGRNYHHALKYYRALGMTGPLVTSDGACVSIPGGAIIQERKLPLEISRAILRLSQDSQVSCLCFFRHGIYVTSKFDWNEGMDRHREIGSHFREVKPAAMHKTAIYKTLHFSKTPARLDDLQAKVSELYGDSVDVIRNGPNTLEVLPKGVSKVSGLKAVAEYLGLDSSQFVVFGDGNNDLGMFAWAGYSVCMHHGSPLALKSARMVAPETAIGVNFAAAVDAMIDVKGEKERVA
jgi:Cof subfamily protein (haloacid dehalogenase superfamily)